MLNQSNIKVTVIDDDLQMTEMLKDFIEQKYPAAAITVYHSGEDALEKIFEQPDMIILDYHLDSKNSEAMNGVQILKKLKDRYPDVHIVFVSGQEKAEVAANTMKYGAYDYIVKNENAFQRLEIVVKNILGNAQLKKTAGTQKFFNYLLVALIAALIIGIVVMKMS
ncbi:MAG: response regulator [Bacteroidia bacterium]|nr:response regulator [Bacteroidia bacterium]